MQFRSHWERSLCCADYFFVNILSHQLLDSKHTRDIKYLFTIVPSFPFPSGQEKKFKDIKIIKI